MSNKAFLDQTFTRAQDLSADIGAGSQSPAPYEAQTSNLGDTLKDAQQKGLTVVGNLRDAAMDASASFQMLIADTEQQLSAPMINPAAITNAISVGQGQLHGVFVKSQEALQRLNIDINAVRSQLFPITLSANPPLSTFLAQFVAGTVFDLVTAAPTPAPTPASTAAPPTVVTSPPGVSPAGPKLPTVAPATTAAPTPAPTPAPVTAPTGS